MSTTYEIAAYPKETALRDNSIVTIRPLAPQDRDPLLAFFLGVPGDERYFLKDEVTSPRLIEQWTQDLDFRRALPLVAVAEDRIIAEAVLIRKRGNARSHVCEVRVVVLPEYRSRGLGTILIRELCDIADEEGLEKVLFEVVEGREDEALKAAQWLGFIRVGTFEGGARDQEGHPYDVVLMAMPLGKWYEWSKY